jgi:hypothetical protein
MRNEKSEFWSYIFYILNIAVVFIGVSSIFMGHGEDLFLGFLILGVSLTTVIFVKNNNPSIRIKYSNSITALNVIGGILFLTFLYSVNNFFNDEFLVTFVFSTLVGLYVGANILYIRSLKKPLKIDEPKKIEKVEHFEEDSGLSNSVEAKQMQTLTPASNLFIDEQSANIEDEKECLPVPKKVDWDSVQKARKQTGDFGEVIVVEYEKAVLLRSGKSDLSAKVVLVSSKNLGYDVLSKFDDGSDKYIEVKAFAGSKAHNFVATRNELDFLKENPDSSFVYMVTNCDAEPKILMMSARQFFKLKLKPSVFKITL